MRNSIRDNNPSMADMDERLRRARLGAGYATAADAVAAFGFKASTYYGHENGDRQISRRAAMRYARAFHTDPGYLLYGRINPPADPAALPPLDDQAVTLVLRLAFERGGLPPVPARNFAQALTAAARTLSGLPEGELTEARALSIVEALANAFARLPPE